MSTFLWAIVLIVLTGICLGPLVWFVGTIVWSFVDAGIDALVDHYKK